MRKPTEFEVEQTIFLGGQISREHKEMMMLAFYDPDDSFIIWFMENFERLETLDESNAMLEIIKTFGKIELIRSSTELTRLSMIVGDTTKKLDLRKEMDELRESDSRNIPNTKQ